MRFSVFVLLLLVFIPFASAYRHFYYSDEVDFGKNLDYSNRNYYDRFDPDLEFCKYNCISLDAYNDFANHNPYDKYDPITANSPESTLKKLRYDDYNRIANTDPHDNVDVDDFELSDMSCWTLSDYNSYADLDPHDGWHRADLTDLENFDKIIHSVGRSRFHFFDYESLYELR